MCIRDSNQEEFAGFSFINDDFGKFQPSSTAASAPNTRPATDTEQPSQDSQPAAETEASSVAVPTSDSSDEQAAVAAAPATVDAESA